MRTNRWSHVPGRFSLEVWVENQQAIDIDGNTIDLPPEAIALLPDQDLSEIVIDFRSRGYYMPASRYGGPDNLGWPAEGEDERTLDEAYLLTGSIDDERKIKLSRPVQESLFDLFEERIDEVELDYEVEDTRW